MRDYAFLDTHTHSFPTREVGQQTIQALPHPGAPGVVEDLLPDLAADGPGAEVRRDPQVLEICLGA